MRCKNLRGPWQEVELKVHKLEEIDTPHFWKFLEAASEGFQKITNKKQEKPEDLMPWKVMGKKWHLMTKGFPPGRPPKWKPQLAQNLTTRNPLMIQNRQNPITGSTITRALESARLDDK